MYIIIVYVIFGNGWGMYGYADGEIAYGILLADTDANSVTNNWYYSCEEYRSFHVYNYWL